jgi:hypothetical protein
VTTLINSPNFPEQLSVEKWQLERLIPIAVLIGCLMPWIEHRASSLTWNLYELAEWTTLVPDLHTTSPTLLVSLGLRTIMVIAILNLSISIPQFRWMLLIVAGMALLPPIEFFTLYRNDPNYQQQFGMVVTILLLGGGLKSRQLICYRYWWILIGGAISLFSAAGCLLVIQHTIDAFHFQLQVGLGFFVTVAFICLHTISSLFVVLNRQKNRTA